MLIVFEGADGVGKSKQARMWQKHVDELYIYSRKIMETKGRWHSFDGIRLEMPRYYPQPEDFFKRRVAQLDTPNWLRFLYEFMREREHHYSKFLLMVEDANRAVTFDRYILSSYVYQMRLNFPKILGEAKMRDLFLAHQGFLLKPDLTIVYTMSDAERERRIKRRDGDHAADLKHSKAYDLKEGYEEATVLARRFPELAGPVAEIALSGEEDIYSVHMQTKEVIADFLPAWKAVCQRPTPEGAGLLR